MTDRTQSSEPHAGAPFGVMLRGALVPSVLAGLLAAVVLVGVRGVDALAGALIGLVVSVAFFASGMYRPPRIDSVSSLGAMTTRSSSGWILRLGFALVAVAICPPQLCFGVCNMCHDSELALHVVEC